MRCLGAFLTLEVYKPPSSEECNEMSTICDIASVAHSRGGQNLLLKTAALNYVLLGPEFS